MTIKKKSNSQRVYLVSSQLNYTNPEPNSYDPYPIDRPDSQHLLRHPRVRVRQKSRSNRLKKFFFCCSFPFFIVILIGLLISAYFIYPIRHNILLLGIDYTDPSNAVARSDTIILLTVDPSQPYVGSLSIPRDLWVDIPGVGQNRINTAHYFAEIQKPGSGPRAVRNLIDKNFGVDVPYHIRIRFEGFREIVDALGGVDISLDETMAGYPSGQHHLTGRKALAFVRNRQGADDFFRMAYGQFMIKSLFKNMLNPIKWPRLPAVWRAFHGSTKTNLPIWIWPRMAFTILVVGPDGTDNKMITREMTVPYTTDQGANVLAPVWELILPVVNEMFLQ